VLVLFRWRNSCLGGAESGLGHSQARMLGPKTHAAEKPPEVAQEGLARDWERRAERRAGSLTLSPC
jgi:hypothetical protein